MAKITAGSLVHQRGNFVELLEDLAAGALVTLFESAAQVLGVPAQLCSDAVRRQDVVGQTRGNGRPRHPGMLGGFGRLHDDGSATLGNLSQAKGAIGAVARQHDRDGPAASGLREGSEKVIDVTARAVRLRDRTQAEVATLKA